MGEQETWLFPADETPVPTGPPVPRSIQVVSLHKLSRPPAAPLLYSFLVFSHQFLLQKGFTLSGDYLKPRPELLIVVTSLAVWFHVHLWFDTDYAISFCEPEWVSLPSRV